MHIERLVLEGYRHLKLRKIRRFDYTPQKRIQFLMGTNGSGKSSVLRQLSPLPGSPDDFYTPGKKEIWITHQGRNYHLSSVFGEDKNYYYFEVDGENLNKSRLISGYRDLVLEHFNYQMDIHLLLTGQQTFTNMSVAERRQLFMKMPDEDYSYALAAFKKIKERIKDRTSLLKQLQHRLGGEIQKLIPEDKINEEIAAVKKEREVLESLLSYRQRVDVNKTSDKTPQEAHSELLLSFNVLSNILASVSNEMEYMATEPLAETKKRISLKSVQISNKLASLNTAYQYLVQSLLKLQKLDEELTEASSVNKDEVSASIKTNRDEVAKLKAILFMPEVGAILPFSIEHKLRGLLTTIEEEASKLKPIVDETNGIGYTRNDLFQLTEAHRATLAQIEANEVIEQRKRIELGKIETYLNSDEVSCPKCNYHWKLNYSETEHKCLTRDLSAIVEIQKSLDEKQSKQLTALRKIQEYLRIVDFFYELTRDREIGEFLSQVDKKKSFLEDPGSFTANLQLAISDFSVRREIRQLEGKIESQEKLIQQITSASSVNSSKVKQDLKDDEERLEKIRKELNDINAENRKLKSILDLIASLESAEAQMTTSFQGYQKAINETIKSTLIQAEHEIIHQLQLSVASKERNITQAGLLKHHIETLKQEISLLEKTITLLKESARSLSPTEGLIAKGMTSFINSFVDTANGVIASVWEYPMQIAPVTIKSDEDFELDYRFVVNIDDGDDSPSSDISLCSVGMQEIINLAMTFTARSFLGLEQFPVFLDEFAVNLDETHRKAAFAIVEKLSEQAGVAQTFIVSHHAKSYGSFANADVTVLCDANIMLPAHITCNNAVIIE